MATHLIPRNVKGEVRYFNIFTAKSLLTMLIGLAVGIIFFLIFNALTLKAVAWVMLAIFGGIGFLAGAFKVPYSTAFSILKKIGGDYIGDVIRRYIKFKKNNKIYVYERRSK